MNRYISSIDDGKSEVYPYRVHSKNPHNMRILNNGIAALYQRISMIRNAKNSLELEYFIFNPDQAGRIVVSELIKAAQRGVKVRIMVDKSVAVFALDEYYAKVLKANNIEIRYYNPASFIRISTVQFRDHRKLIVRDGEEAITGGRNIANEYFNLAEEFNFLDRDIWVKGEIVKSMKDSFNVYWDSSIVEKPKDVMAPRLPFNINNSQAYTTYQQNLKVYEKKTAEAKSLVSLTDEDKKALNFIMSYGRKALTENNIHSCSDVAFATDREGGNFKARLDSKNYNTNYRLLRKEIAAWMSKVDDEIILDSPYFLNDKNSKEIVDNLLENKKKVTILTNSLASTDAVYVSTVFADHVAEYTPNDLFSAYIYKGVFSDESELFSDKIKNSIWGTHSKTIVYNDNSFMIGTFNIDNRSNFYNSEMAIFCSGSQDLTRDVEDNIKLRMKSAHHLNKEGLPDDGSKLLEGNTGIKKIEYFFIKVPSHVMNFLL